MPTPLQILLDPASLTVLAIYGALILLEAVNPLVGAAVGVLMRTWKKSLGSACFVALAAVVPAHAAETSVFKPWIDGTREEPEMQVQLYDPDTYVIRQSIRTNFEGPFLYLYFGKERALLLDTGAGGLKILPTIEKVMTEWSAKNGRKSIPLVVAHTHAHGDHHQGDAEFAGRPDTVVVGLTPKDVADFFKITDWPNQIVPFDLGGRVLHIIPTPGHEPSHIMVFDEKTRILQGGDAFGPCRLLFSVNNFKAFRDSTDRVVAFTAGRNVSHILGNHIEMTGTPGNVYPMRAPSHPDEPLLELKFSDLLDLQKALHAQGDRPVMEPHDRFMIYPLTFAPPAPPAQ